MAITLENVLASLPVRRRRAVEAKAAQLMAQEMTLRDLRRAMGKTQVQLATRIGKPQATISRIEQQSDMLLSTLNEVVQAMGGRVRIIAELPDREPVILTGFSDIEPTKKAPSKRPQTKPKPRAARKSKDLQAA